MNTSADAFSSNYLGDRQHRATDLFLAIINPPSVLNEHALFPGIMTTLVNTRWRCQLEFLLEMQLKIFFILRSRISTA